MKRKIYIYPFLFALFPILFLYAKNMVHFPLGVLISPVLKVFVFVVFLSALFNAIFKNIYESSLYVSLFLISFFLYFHFVNLANQIPFVEAVVATMGDYQAIVPFPFWVVYFAIVAVILINKVENLNELTSILGFTGLILVMMPVLTIAVYQFKHRGSIVEKENLERTEVKILGVTDPGPDIYYLILDGYGRSDVLREMYDYDNSEFIKFLENKGFYVANRATSNYNQTFLSLSSSLNFNYIENLIDISGFDTNNRTPLYEIIKNSKTFSLAKENGYDLVVVSSGYPGTEIKNADTFITGASRNDQGEFENALLNMTPIPGLAKILGSGSLKDFEELYRERILNIFSELEMVAEKKSPKFVFVHLMSPHPPFLFDKDGKNVSHKKALEFTDGSHLISKDGITKDEYINLYKGQTAFVDYKMTGVVEAILSKSERPPIIIIQGDHGPGSELDWENMQNSNFYERHSILNAYHLPDEEIAVPDDSIYETITPVNTFRFIFNRYFGTDYEKLEDNNYFSTSSHPYHFIDVTGKTRN